MATAYEDLYAAAQVIMGDVNTAAPTTIVIAQTNYGTDFRITPGEGLYQIRVTGVKRVVNSNVAYPRATCSVILAHYVTTPTNESDFVHATMNELASRWLLASVWEAQAGIFSLQADLDAEIDEGERVGNVITFEASASVLMDPI